MNKKSSREISYLACQAAFTGKSYIQETLQKWIKTESPSPQEQDLAKFLAAGVVKFAIACDAIARKLNKGGSLPSKSQEKTLLRHTLFQVFYQPSAPFYAIASESALLAKKYTKQPFQRFLTALLKKCEERTLPPLDLFERTSYPKLFVDKLLTAYGQKQTEEILEAGNQEMRLFSRKRKGADSFCTPLASDEVERAILSSDEYIQNPTPWLLCLHLSKHLPKIPSSIWDACAAPGGKLLALQDLYPHANLWASDPSPLRVKTLKQNIDFYKINSKVEADSIEKAFFGEKWDLVVIDVPCSNSGVLRKRPEARHRLTKEKLRELLLLQKHLLRQALERVNPGGFLWYMTCSILPEENQLVANSALNECTLLAEKLYLPKLSGEDGGYGALLQKKAL